MPCWMWKGVEETLLFPDANVNVQGTVSGLVNAKWHLEPGSGRHFSRCTEVTIPSSWFASRLLTGCSQIFCDFYFLFSMQLVRRDWEYSSEVITQNNHNNMKLYKFNCKATYCWVWRELWHTWHSISRRSLLRMSNCGSHFAVLTFLGCPGKVSASHFQSTLCGSSENACTKACLLSSGSVSAWIIEPMLK